MISLKKALGQLLMESTVKYYKCTIYKDCNVTLSINNTNIDNNNTNTNYTNNNTNNTNNIVDIQMNVYDFFNYFYNSIMNETFDFNLLMITAFLGNLLLKSRGFKISSSILCLFNFGVLFWLPNLNFKFNEDGVFDYNFIKILSILVLYIILLIGVGASALLSQQILIDSHLKYQKYIISLENEKLQGEKESPKEESLNFELKNNNEEEINEVSIIAGLDRKNKKREKNLKKENNKFGIFFMICLTTTIAYFGKYSLNLLLSFILNKIIGEKFLKDKIYFFYGVIGLYALSISFSIAIYSIFVSIFTKNPKIKEKDEYRICQICGYIFYSQKIFLKENSHKCCSCCQNDFDKNQEFFCYCYQAQRKSFWFFEYITNGIQKKIVPYMIKYFFLQITTIGFEIQYEKYKGKNIHIKTNILAFIISFILFLYLTLSFSRLSKGLDKRYQKKNKDKEIEILSKLSYEILKGFYGILLFNGVFSIIISIPYTSDFHRILFSFQFY